MTYSELEDELSGALNDIREERNQYGNLYEIIGRFGFKPLGAFPALDKKLNARLDRILKEIKQGGMA